MLNIAIRVIYIYIYSLNPYNNLLREKFYRWINSVTEKLNSLPKIKQLVSAGVGFKSGSLAPKSSFLPTIYTASLRREGKEKGRKTRKERRNSLFFSFFFSRSLFTLLGLSITDSTICKHCCKSTSVGSDLARAQLNGHVSGPAGSSLPPFLSQSHSPVLQNSLM